MGTHVPDKGVDFIKPCSICQDLYPTSRLKLMVSILEQNAYLEKVCPKCQKIALKENFYFFKLQKAPV